jgi:hypothetical protein
MIGINISGSQKFIAALEAKKKDIVYGIDQAMQESVVKINLNQKVLAPKDTTTMATSLIWKKESICDYVIKSEGAGSSYAPYQEFGTGGYVFMGEGWVDEELASFASQFKGRGIRKVNLRPQPFFYPPFFEEAPKLIAKIKALLGGNSSGSTSVSSSSNTI